MELISLVGPLLTGIITAAGVYAMLTNRLTALETLVSELKHSVDKHNGVVERTYKLESDNVSQWKRLDDLKDEVKLIRASCSAKKEKE